MLASLIEGLRILTRYEGQQGLFILNTQPNGAGAVAGIRSFDLMTEYDGHKLVAVQQLTKLTSREQEYGDHKNSATVQLIRSHPQGIERISLSVPFGKLGVEIVKEDAIRGQLFSSPDMFTHQMEAFKTRLFLSGKPSSCVSQVALVRSRSILAEKFFLTKATDVVSGRISLRFSHGPTPVDNPP